MGTKFRSTSTYSFQVERVIQTLKHLRFMSITPIRNKRFLGQINLCYSHGKGHNNRHKLPKYCANVFENGEQGNLDSANLFRLLHHVTKSSKRKAKCIEAVEITSDGKNSVVCNRSSNYPCDNSQYQYYEVDNETDEV